MLVLTRKQDQSIVLGDNIRITIVAVKGGAVRIGIDAPKDIPIRREELDSVPVGGDDDAAGSSWNDPDKLLELLQLRGS